MEEGGDPPEQKRALLAQGLQEREGGDPLTKRRKGGALPKKKHALLAKGLQ